jgi:hypothetical protein
MARRDDDILDRVVADGELFDVERERVRLKVRRALVGSGEELEVGRFVLRAPLGSGANGMVYVAFDPVLGRSVAVKLVKPRGGQAGAQRLHREARALARINHPNVVTVFEAGDFRGCTFVALELVEGVTLDVWIRERRPSWRRILVALAGAARGLQAAHDVGVLHRDVKPANLVVDGADRVRVLDFGLARALHADPDDAPWPVLPRSSLVVGTPAYMAPEQLAGEEIDARADQFGFCVTAYEALFGVRPFAGTDRATQLEAIRRGLPPPPAGELPAAVHDALARGLAADPVRRHASLGALADVFDRLAGATPARPRRHRMLLAGTLVLLAIVGGVAVLALPRGGAAPAAARAPVDRVACPLLEARGVPEPTGWLGAAAAASLCRHVGWVLGGAEERTIVAAELLELPVLPGDDYPHDPYGAPDARARSLEAARRRGAAYLDGTIERVRGRFRLEVRLRDGDRVLGTGAGEGRSLHVAVAAAVDELVRAGALAPRAIDPEVAEWTLLRTHQEGLAILTLEQAIDQGRDVDAVCDDARRLHRTLGPAMLNLRMVCDLGAPAPLSRETPAAMAATAPDQVEGREALAAELARARASEPSRLGQATLALAEARLWIAADDHARARSLALVAAAAAPRATWIRQLTLSTALADAGMVMAARARAAWVPDLAGSWFELSFLDELPGSVFHHRAWVLRPSGVVATAYASELVTIGRREEARLLAAELAAAGPYEQVAAEYTLAIVDASEARFDRAYQRLRRLFAQREVFGKGHDGDVTAFDKLLYLGDILGRSAEIGDELARRFVLGESRLLTIDSGVSATLVGACRRARREVALACLARVAALPPPRGFNAGLAEGDALLLRGAERHVRGDVAGAVDTWRSLITLGYHRIELPPEAFDAVGELDLGSLLDVRRLEMGGRYNGADPAHAREARRAARRGDHARARALARQVIDAWSAADAPIPAVDDMRALLREIES